MSGNMTEQTPVGLSSPASTTGMNGTQSGGSGGPPPGFQCHPCGCAPPPGFENGPPPPGIYAEVAVDIWKIVPPILLSIGTVGNCLTIIVIARQWRKLTSTAIYLLVLALSDMIILYSGLLRQWIKTQWTLDVRSHGEIGCKFSVYLTYSSIQLSSWILVAVTMERVITVVWPHKVRYGCTPRLAGIVLLVMSVVILGLNVHVFYGHGPSELPRYNGQSICDPLNENYFRFFHDIWPWIDFLVAFALPFAILTAGNVIIIYKLSKSRARRRKLSIIGSPANESYNRDTRTLTIVLITLSVVFFICMTPVSIYFIYLPYRMEKLEENMCDDLLEYLRQNEITRLLYAVTNVILYVNASVNFFLYVISGSKFRADIKSLFLCRPKGSDSLFGSSTRSSSEPGSRVLKRTTTETSTTSSNCSINTNATKSTDPYVGQGPSPNQTVGS